MNSNENLFEDIEQDNNPSFYGHKPTVKDPNREYDEVGDQQNSIVNSSIGLSNRINKYLNDSSLEINVISSERIVNSSIVVYSIELSTANNGPIIVKRRYSEFKSLRDNLTKLFPTVVIPPIPEKHSIFKYVVNSFSNASEISIVETRKRHFKDFLVDLIFKTNNKVKECSLLHKFLDPNYEMSWSMALNEPPVNLVPNNMLLANPVEPTDQNGLYYLLPQVNGFEWGSTIDNLSPLRKLNEDFAKLNDQIEAFECNEQNTDSKETAYSRYKEVPADLISFEVNFNKIIRVLNDLNKLNSRSSRIVKAVINNLVELGGNLNNFSLQIYDPNSNELSIAIEKFGSTIDSQFLDMEAFLVSGFVPKWQEPVSQFVQYYLASLQLIKFYKYKVIQFKILYNLKFNKINELSNYNNKFKSHVQLNNLKNMQINSPTINRAIQQIENQRKSGKSLNKKPSWYSLFGSSRKQTFTLEEQNTLNVPEEDIGSQFKYKIDHIEKELDKLDQLIELSNRDMIGLSAELDYNFNDFLAQIEKKWIIVMLEFIRSGKKLFEDGLSNWSDLKAFLNGEVIPNEVST